MNDLFLDLPLNLSTKPGNPYQNYRHHPYSSPTTTPAATPSPTMRTTGPGIWSPASVLEAEQQTKFQSYIASHLIAQHLNPNHHSISLVSATPLLQASLALTNNNNNIVSNGGGSNKSMENVIVKGKGSRAKANLLNSINNNNNCTSNNHNGTKDLIGANINNNNVATNNTKGNQSRARASPVSVSSSTEVATKPTSKKTKKSQNGSPRTFQVRMSDNADF